MRAIVTILLFYCSVTCVKAQQSYFSKRYNISDTYTTADFGKSVVPVDGGYYISGNFVFPGGRRDIIIMFVDSFGEVNFKKSYGKEGFAHFDGGRGSLITTSDGGYALGGGVTDSTLNNDAMLWKFNANGDSLWARRYGDTLFQAGMQCKQTLDGGFVLVGANSKYDIDGDFWLIKTDSLGNMEWEQTYGGGGYEYATTVVQTKDKGYLLAGDSESFGGGVNIYIVKTDSLGNQQWSRVFGGPNSECVWNVEQTLDGGYVIGGCLTDNEPVLQYPYGQPYIIKLDSAGNTEWDKTYGPIRYSTTAFMVRELADGSFIATGQTTDAGELNQVGFVLKLSATGDSLWYRTHAFSFSDGFSYNILYDIQQTSDSGFIACGWTEGPGGFGQDMWVLKLDSMGCFRPNAGFTYVVQDDSVGFTNLSSPEMYIWDFGDGDTLSAWNDQLGTSPAHTYSDSGNYIVTLTVVSSACNDTSVFIDTVYVAPFTGLKEGESAELDFIKVYPNPFSGSATVEINSTVGACCSALYIYNLAGQRIKTYNLSQDQTTVTLTSNELGSGMFFIHLISDGSVVSNRKIVVTE